MPPTESSILTSFLLPPAPLPTIISPKKFTSLFPKSQHSNPHITDLYRDLQHTRALNTDQVTRNIAREVKNGERQRREVVKARRIAKRGEVEGVDTREVDMEVELWGPISDAAASRPHTLSSILPEMEQACADIEAETTAIAEEADMILENLRTTIGDLSDLRYGRFSQSAGSTSDFCGDILERLRGLDEICAAKLR